MSKRGERKARRELVKRATDARVHLKHDPELDGVLLCDEPELGVEFIRFGLPLLVMAMGSLFSLAAMSWLSILPWALLTCGVISFNQKLLVKRYYIRHWDDTIHLLQTEEYSAYVNKAADPEERIARANIFWPIWDEYKKVEGVRNTLHRHIKELEADHLEDKAEYAELKQAHLVAEKESFRLSEAIDNLLKDTQTEVRMKQLEKLRLANEALESARASMSDDISPGLERSMLMHDLITSDGGEFSKIMREIEVETEKAQRPAEDAQA